MSEIENLFNTVNKWLEGKDDKEKRLELCREVSSLSTDSLYIFLNGFKNLPEREMVKMQKFFDSFHELQTYRLEALSLIFGFVAVKSNDELESIKRGLDIARENKVS